MSIVGSTLEQNFKTDSRTNKLPDKRASDAFLENLDEFDTELDEEQSEELGQGQSNYDLAQGEFSNEQGHDENSKNKFLEEEEESDEESQNSSSEQNSKSSKRGSQSSFWASEVTTSLTSQDYLAGDLSNQIEAELIDMFNEESLQDTLKLIDSDPLSEEQGNSILINAELNSKYQNGEEFIIENDEAIKDQNFLEILDVNEQSEHLNSVISIKDQPQNSDQQQHMLELELDEEVDQEVLQSIIIDGSEEHSLNTELSIISEENINDNESLNTIEITNNQDLPDNLTAQDAQGLSYVELNTDEEKAQNVSEVGGILIGSDSEQNSNSQDQEEYADSDSEDNISISTQQLPANDSSSINLTNDSIVLDIRNVEHKESADLESDADADADIEITATDSTLSTDEKDEALGSGGFGQGSNDDQNRKEIIDLYRKEIMKGIFEISLSDGRQAVVIQLGGSLENVSIILTRRDLIWCYQFTFIHREDYLFFFEMRDVIHKDLSNNLMGEFEIVLLDPDLD
ncbi:MAG: hypothetical protein V4629_07305 [Pseudomonadota bacterium]